MHYVHKIYKSFTYMVTNNVKIAFNCYVFSGKVKLLTLANSVCELLIYYQNGKYLKFLRLPVSKQKFSDSYPRKQNKL